MRTGYLNYKLVLILFSPGTVFNSLSDQLLDFKKDRSILEQTCLTSLSLPLILYPNGFPCLVLKSYCLNKISVRAKRSISRVFSLFIVPSPFLYIARRKAVLTGLKLY